MRLLDLFCGAGGAAMGYSQAGFTEIVGVDIEPQPNYPFDMYVADAIYYATTDNLQRFDLIHASPPCQRFSTLAYRNGNGDDWPDLIPPTRKLLKESGVPYVIENVEGAPLVDPVMLCGTMFDGLRVLRHRLFETSFPVEVPEHGRHPFGVHLRQTKSPLWTTRPGHIVRTGDGRRERHGEEQAGGNGYRLDERVRIERSNTAGIHKTHRRTILGAGVHRQGAHSMTVQSAYWVICDGCGQPCLYDFDFPTADSLTAAREQAKKRGWHHEHKLKNAPAIDLCDACLVRLEWREQDRDFSGWAF